MKKTLVALAVMVAAGSAQAIELYNKDGVTVDLKGDVEVRYKKGTAENANTKQEIDDADFGFDTRYAVNDDLKIGAYLEFSGDNSDRAQDKSSVGNVYVGLYSDTYGSLKIGKLDTIMDDSGIGSDFLFGISSFVEDAPFGGEEAARYDYDNGSFYLGLGLIQDKHDAQSIGRDGHYYDAKAGYRVSDLDFTAFLASAELRGSSTKDVDAVDATTGVVTTTRTTTNYDHDVSLLGLEVRYAGIENLNLELGYYTNEVEARAGGSKSEEDTIGVAADYTYNSITFAAGYSSTDKKNSSDKDINNWFTNVAYSFAPNTEVYAEVGGTSKDNTETGYGIGIKTKF